MGRDDSLADPDHDAARIRAMYTHPEWSRQGIGTLLLELGEEAARNAGFKTIELGSTIPGEPFYLARGFTEGSREVRVRCYLHAEQHPATVKRFKAPPGWYAKAERVLTLSKEFRWE